MLCFFLLLSLTLETESRYCEIDFVEKDGESLVIKKYVKNFDKYREDTFENEKEANRKIQLSGGHPNIAKFISAGDCTLTFERVSGMELFAFSDLQLKPFVNFLEFSNIIHYTPGHENTMIGFLW